LRPPFALPELPESELPDFAEPDWPVPETLDELGAAWALVACAGPGSVNVTPAAVSTLAILAAAVTARILARFLFRLATAGGAGVIGALPLLLPEVVHLPDIVHSGLANSEALLRALPVPWDCLALTFRLLTCRLLTCRAGAANRLSPEAVDGPVHGAVEISRGQRINNRCPVDG
jgi:hypothetical protein